MTNNTCPSIYAPEANGTTYTCIREDGHPGVHRSSITHAVEACDVYTGRPNGKTIEEPMTWTDWMAFLAVQLHGSDAEVLAAGAALIADEDWYADMLGRQARYAALAGTR
ncbi:hypothetical protein ACFVJK_46785 [Streptomyces sp. NPDC127172]|uniref:hypothetical protein n=1 Tax=Streptomyces sp. NPDC127172 TaxID=3345382 RepID=UPI00363A07FB